MVARIAVKDLAELCRRAATSHATGVDARKIWKREADRGKRSYRHYFLQVSQAVDRGSTLADAFNQTGEFLPPLFRDMVQVGEQTGRVDQALDRLASHYDHVRRVRGAFLAGIAWPAIQLMLAICVIGLVIFLMGVIGGGTDEFDPVGFGLSGARGAAIYFACVFAIVVAGYLMVLGAIRGRFSAMIMASLMRLPVVGQWLQLMALSRMSWTLAMAVEAGMDAQQCVAVALRSTQNHYFLQHRSRIEESIARGESLHEAFGATGAFPTDFLDAVEVGEDTGRLPESLDTLSKIYEERGKLAMSSAAVMTGFLVWAGVGAIIVFFIFRFAMFYLNLLNSFT